MITRDEIINKLNEKLHPLDYIYALWLEGSDANNKIDEYSDLDIWVDFEDEYEEEAIQSVENALSEIARIDYKYVMEHSHPKIRQRIYHLLGCSKYLMIDFCFQLHSRSKKEWTYLIGDEIEAVKVVFDKRNLINFKELNLSDFKEWNEKRLRECLYRYSQHNRVEKYIYRGEYLEAYAYYNRYVLEPLVDLLRIKYTPAHANYYLIHISKHLPKEIVEKLTSFARISSLKDIVENIPLAQKWFNELIKEIKKQGDLNE